ncbi:hypothetical protein [Halalkalicoccus salilacus]|uniref:hypothetical protein n=1 Tax=Halalkalicoccus TaxID=332246 RepID=UPI002F96A038
MANGADYPGYSEPEPEKEPVPIVKVQRGFWKLMLKYSALPFIIGIIASGKMVIASLLGAFLATNMELTIESLLPFILNMMGFS